MSEKPYKANYDFALSYLKLGQKDAAIEALSMALSQVPDHEKNEKNNIYLSILSTLAFLLVENRDFENAARYVEEGLAVKKEHADLLFVKSLLLLDMKRFDEMLETIIHYLLSVDKGDNEQFNYKYIHEGVMDEIYGTLLPMASRYSVEYAKIRDIVQKLCKATGSERIKKAFDVMTKAETLRNDMADS
ncbi:MAG: hypothetical protein ACLQF0_08405 [Dissulfurispiraceae bacterium]